MKPEKGVFLSALIIFYGIAIFTASAFLITNQGIRHLLGNLPGWFNPYVVALLLVRFIALFAIWQFKRWGVYLLGMLGLVELSLGIFVIASFITISTRLFVAVPTLILLVVIWWLALYPKWQIFR